jgi:hypothetical protein
MHATDETRRSAHLLPMHSCTRVAPIDVPFIRSVDLQGPELQRPERDTAQGVERHDRLDQIVSVPDVGSSGRMWGCQS